METEKYLSTGQLMDYLKISRSTVYRSMAKGMPDIMVGTVIAFRDSGGGLAGESAGNKLNDIENRDDGFAGWRIEFN